MKRFLLLALFVSLAQADVVTIDSSTQTFQNTDCAKTDSCDLKDFVLTQEDYHLTVPSQSLDGFGTRMHAYYDTASLDSLEKYGIAQFIQGCQFDSQFVNGQVVNSQDVEIEHYGNVIPFHFAQEVIDGFVADPLDWGADTNAPSRFFFYLNKFIGSNEPQQDDYYGVQKPAVPRLYLRDMPGVAELIDATTARNISLHFRDCIYKAADVARNVPDTQVNFAVPLQCFEWNSSFVYNFQTKSFDRPVGLVDFCR